MHTDLFQQPAGETPALPGTATVPHSQYLRSPCECGAGGGWRKVQHYDVLRCQCGKEFWALRPKLNGPLVAVPWPGLPGMDRRVA